MAPMLLRCAADDGGQAGQAAHCALGAESARPNPGREDWSWCSAPRRGVAIPAPTLWPATPRPLLWGCGKRRLRRASRVAGPPRSWLPALPGRPGAKAVRLEACGYLWLRARAWGRGGYGQGLPVKANDPEVSGVAANGLTVKELGFIEESIKMEALAWEKLVGYERDATDPELRDICRRGQQTCQRHIDELLELLQ